MTTNDISWIDTGESLIYGIYSNPHKLISSIEMQWHSAKFDASDPQIQQMHTKLMTSIWKRWHSTHPSSQSCKHRFWDAGGRGGRLEIYICIWPRPFWRPWFWDGKSPFSTLVALSRQNSIFGPIHSQSGPKSEHFNNCLHFSILDRNADFL